MNDRYGKDYDEARSTALTLPTWVLLMWERRATQRVIRGTPSKGEQERLLAVRQVIHQRADP